MKKIFYLLLLLITNEAFSQSDTSKKYIEIDSVVITAFGKRPIKNIPYNIERVNLKKLQLTPRPQLMQHLSQLPSVSAITSGGDINKPVIRGLSFNQLQMFANGTRIDNQTWDDRHDIGIADVGYDKIEIINGPAALVYGPNTLGGALAFEEKTPGVNEKANGYVNLGYFGNSIGGNLSAGIREGKKDWFYSLYSAYQMHANYVQGEGEETNPPPVEEDKPLAPNSKFTNMAFKGMIGVRKEKSLHKFTYSLYSQNLGIIEDESNNTTPVKEERDYEMEAPYQNVNTHVLSLENTFNTGKSDVTVNVGYQFNKRKEFEPGTLPKSKFLGVGLDLSTLTGDVQWHSDKTKSSGITVGVQGFYQNNKNTGNFVLVPDAHVSTVGAFVLGHTDYKQWNFLYGVRIDAHKLDMFTTIPKLDDGYNPSFPAPNQNISGSYTPYSFSAGVVYHPAKEWSLKLNLANGYAAPNYAHLTAYGKHEGTYRFEVGNNDLKMEKNIEVDATAAYTNADISFSLNGYINSINDYIYINPTNETVDDLKVYRWTQNDATISGIETNLEVHPTQVKWFEGYIRAGVLRGKLKDGKGDLPYIPANKVITGLTWKKDDGKKWKQWYATLQLSSYGKQSKVAEFEEQTDGYFLADVFAGVSPSLGRHHRWNLTAFCTNLFNKGYFNHLSLVKTIDIREPGRNIGLQVSYNF
ncbi:MAG: TonB-dependent receptor [Sphingobacteriales bacterium]|nr:TonB-dependent receptor [Sphingobacteriales bacterium]